MSSKGPKRTNSLGRAASDCFACQKLAGVSHTRCDRQRPRCNVCTDAGKVCSGYLQEFQWQGGAQRALWKTKNHVEPTTRTSASDSSSSGTQIPNTSVTSSQPAAQRSARVDKQRFLFIQENVEADYIDKSFSSAARGGSTSASRDRGVNERRSPLERRRGSLPHFEYSAHALAARQANVIESSRSEPLPPPFRFDRNPQHSLPHQAGHSAPWLSTTFGGIEPARLSLPGAPTTPIPNPYAHTTRRELSRPRAERPLMSRAVTGPYPTREFNLPRIRSNSTARSTFDDMYQEQQFEPVDSASAQSGSFSSRGRRSWHEVVGSYTPANQEQRESPSSQSTRGRAQSRPKWPLPQ